MSEYIKCKELRKQILEDIEFCGEPDASLRPIAYGTILGLKGALSYINTLPAADVVEVVRCKDCKHFLNDTDYCKEHNKGYCEWDNTIKSKRHFCSYGERETD
jgi:hypothetical protein